MILVFPDLDTFRLALTGGVVPTEVSLTDAAVSFGDDGRIFIDTAAKLPRKANAELTRLGVVGAKRHPFDPQPVSCWLQVLPVTRDPAPPQLSSQAPVLFELPAADQLPTIVGEMLRLGNDRQSYRWVAPSDGSDEPRLLLRVIGPPYYTLLRALDETTTDSPIRAYTEQAPRVWVQVGYVHPFAAQIKLPEGRSLFVRPPRDWSLLDDAPFQDVYEILQFKVPNRPVEWEDAAVDDRLTVPLRLVPGNAAEPAELWVLREDASAQLDSFVRDADERLTQRLKFAVANSPTGEQVIVLRTTPSKLAPPVLPFPGAVGFKPFWKLPNLFIPAGTRLHPTLRRDAVRKLLADDTDTLVWLFPGPHGTFTPETLPEDSFRPLEDWVDYIIETNQSPLKAWVESASFEFDHFICTDNPPPKPKDDKAPKARKTGDRGASDEVQLVPASGAKSGTKGGDPSAQATAYAIEVEVKPPSEWEILRAKLEEKFQSIEGPLDTPERQALWPELAVANAGYGDHAEAALCWVNALWEHEAHPEWVETWARSELRDATFPLTAAELDRRLKPADPTPGEMRQFLAAMLWVAHQPTAPAWFSSRLPAVQRYVEAFEKKLPIRAVWIAAYRLAQLNGADVLGLARVRDRLLQRLLEEGLNAEKDLPVFLRTAGLKDSHRIRLVREKCLELHTLIRTWAEKSGKPSQVAVQSDGGTTLSYIDLLFAFGLAKLGEATASKSLTDAARNALETGKPQELKPDNGKPVAASILYRAYKYRIDQAVAGRPHTGLLPGELLSELQELHKKSQSFPPGVTKNDLGLAHYVISRLREQSRILEPQEKLDPYAEFMKQADDLKKAIADLPKIKDPQALAKAIRDLYRSGSSGRAPGDARFLVLLDSLPLAARVGEQFTVELLGLVSEAMSGAGAGGGVPVPELAKKQGLLLERALYLAGHFDRREVVHKLVEQFTELVAAKSEDQRFELINVVAGQCLRSLRKLGLRDEIDKLLRKLQDAVLKGQPASAMRAKYAAKPDVWGKALQTLLHIAGGWLTFGLTDQATPILDEARTDLLAPGGGKLSMAEYTKLAQAYVSAVGQGPAENGLPRISELFRKIDPTKITNGYTTAPFYSRFHLNLAEEVVLAIVSDDFALGPTARKWLDEDEYLVRRRIHRDMKRHLAGSGL